MGARVSLERGGGAEYIAPPQNSNTFLTVCSGVLLENQLGFQLGKKFPAIYATRRFITAVTSSRHLSLT